MKYFAKDIHIGNLCKISEDSNCIYMRTSYRPFNILTFIVVFDSGNITSENVGSIISIPEDQEVIPIAGNVIVASPEPKLTFGDIKVTESFKVKDNTDLYMKIEQIAYQPFNAVNISNGKLHSFHKTEEVISYDK